MKLFHRGNKEPSEAHVVMANGLITADASHRDQTDAEIMRELGINAHMIEDDKLRDVLLNIASRTTIDKDGKTVHYVLPNFMAMYILGTKLIRTAIIDPVDAEIGILKSRCLLRRVKMKMSDEEYESGGALLVDAVGEIIETNWLCARQGKMAQILKVTPRTYEIRMPHGEAKKEVY